MTSTKNQVFYYPRPPVHMRPPGPDPPPLGDVHTRSTVDKYTHRSLEIHG